MGFWTFSVMIIAARETLSANARVDTTAFVDAVWGIEAL